MYEGENEAGKRRRWERGKMAEQIGNWDKGQKKKKITEMKRRMVHSGKMLVGKGKQKIEQMDLNERNLELNEKLDDISK